MPNAYIYAANNPSESVIAKRRGFGTLVSYNVPPYSRAGLYSRMRELSERLGEFREGDAGAADREAVVDCVMDTGLWRDRPPPGCGGDADSARARLAGMADADFAAYADGMAAYLTEVEGRLFSEGLHVFGRPPDAEQMVQYLDGYFQGSALPPEAMRLVAERAAAGCDAAGAGATLEAAREMLEASYEMSAEDAEAQVAEAIDICRLLGRNTEELDGVVKVLDGEFLEPALGGDILRDGPGVLPTGRNIFSLDPYRMPSPSAMARGLKAARAIIAQHQAQHGEGTYPETVAVALWGLDAIKTRGESVGIVLGLVGARPVKESTGRIVQFELIPLDELAEAEGDPGRPRIDVFSNMSGIFRDSFQNVVDLLDDMFFRAASAEDEPVERNYVRRHALEIADGEGGGASLAGGASARLFSNPAGDFGSMVNERVGSGDWEETEELAATFQTRNSFSYGRGERGKARPQVLRELLKTTDRIVQEIDSVEVRRRRPPARPPAPTRSEQPRLTRWRAPPSPSSPPSTA